MKIGVVDRTKLLRAINVLLKKCNQEFSKKHNVLLNHHIKSRIPNITYHINSFTGKCTLYQVKIDRDLNLYWVLTPLCKKHLDQIRGKNTQKMHCTLIFNFYNISECQSPKTGII